MKVNIAALNEAVRGELARIQQLSQGSVAEPKQ
jgi:hypothetical protein